MASRLKSNPLSRFLAPPGMAELYDSAAANWQAGIDRLGFSAAYDALAISALAYQPMGSGEHILDAGTGTGAAARAFAQRAGSLDCHFDLLDPSPDMLTQAVANIPAPSNPVTGVLGEPSIPENHYDRVLCAHVIEHCPDPQDQVNWLFQRLRPGGMALFAVSKPHWCTSLVRWRWGNSAFAPPRVRAMLAAAGFRQIETCHHPKGPPSRVSCGYLARRPDV